MRHYADIAVGNMLVYANAEAAIRGDVPSVLEACKVSYDHLCKEFHPEAVLHPFGQPSSASSGTR